MSTLAKTLKTLKKMKDEKGKKKGSKLRKSQLYDEDEPNMRDLADELNKMKEIIQDIQAKQIEANKIIRKDDYLARLQEPPPDYVKRDYQTKSELNYKVTGNKRHVEEDPADELQLQVPARSIAP